MASYYFVVVIDDGFWVHVLNESENSISRIEILIDDREIVQKGIPENDEIGIYIPQSKPGTYSVRVVFEGGAVIERVDQEVKPGSFQYETVRNDKIFYQYRGSL